MSGYPVKIADGDATTLGTTTDTAAADVAGSKTVLSLLKGIWNKLNPVAAAQSGTWTVQAAQSGTWTVTSTGTSTVAGTIAATQSGAWDATLSPKATGGCSSYRIATTATTNAVNVKASPGQFYGGYLYNRNASERYLKVYNKASAPTSSDTPMATIVIPPTNGAVIDHSMAMALSLGLGCRVTGGISDGDDTAVLANDVHGYILYK